MSSPLPLTGAEEKLEDATAGVCKEAGARRAEATEVRRGEESIVMLGGEEATGVTLVGVGAGSGLLGRAPIGLVDGAGVAHVEATGRIRIVDALEAGVVEVGVLLSTATASGRESQHLRRRSVLARTEHSKQDGVAGAVESMRGSVTAVLLDLQALL
jgi:hypothetical protein